ncbi:hypothetical protein HHK36_027814 [Tetracentron sinense]|uniref:rRNA adenine N(6)-methyltransferase n=1 Tax=Tetracentron sinense TaxID=13715 RepID=A0A834YHC0_TETSI|nr:hypothetical protein HHK36_027814 [Tetracentron sinense]
MKIMSSLVMSISDKYYCEVPMIPSISDDIPQGFARGLYKMSHSLPFDLIVGKQEVVGGEIKLCKRMNELLRVVSNIPFNISTDVVKQLLPMGDIISEVVLLLQDETALRLVDASLRTSEYRPINIFVNFYSDPEYKFKVLRSNFFPQPNVDAAVVTFKLKQTADYPPVASTKSFFSMVNSAFNGKRKMLRRSLQHICTSLEIEKALESVNLPVTARPEELTLDNFVRLHNLLVKI